jgi:CubicO group peptidase (beta-lactamase class C family)
LRSQKLVRTALLLILLAIGSACLLGLASSFTDSKSTNYAAASAHPIIKKEIPKPVMRAELLEKQQRLDSIFSRDSKLGYFNGCVAISYHDTLLYSGSFGTENIDTKEILCKESVFQLASVSKMFTALAILRLVEQNKLSVKDPLEKYFPGFPYAGTTVEHLLTHKSGLPNYLYFYYQYAKSDSLPFSNKRILDILIKDKPLPYFKPGRRFQYSNTNYALLALLVEQLSGQDFPSFVKQEIFDKSGMSHSFFYRAQDTLPHQCLAFNYRKKQVGLDELDAVYGDKGIFSTAEDMLAFSQALFSGKIISSVASATKPRVSTKYGQFYGYGFRINPNGGDTIIFHNGWWHGFRTAFHYRKSDKTTIVVLSNRLDKTAYQTWKILDVLDRKQHSESEIMAAAKGSE